jgi:hypothetical protein
LYDHGIFKEFIKNDALLSMQYRDLSHGEDDARVGQAVFNSNILEQSDWARSWNLFVIRHKKAEAEKGADQDIDPTPG